MPGCLRRLLCTVCTASTSSKPGSPRNHYGEVEHGDRTQDMTKRKASASQSQNENDMSAPAAKKNKGVKTKKKVVPGVDDLKGMPYTIMEYRNGLAFHGLWL